MSVWVQRTISQIMSRPRVRDGEASTVERVFGRVGELNGDHDGFLRAEMPSETASMNNCSDISGAPLHTDTVCPRGGCSLCGRLSHDASCSMSLPWTHSLFPLSFPSSQPASALVSGCEHIDPCPDFSGRAPVQMLMGPEVIVDGSDMLQGSITRRGIVYGVLNKQPFHGTDEPLDTAVLPRASRIAVLQANAQEPQGMEDATFVFQVVGCGLLEGEDGEKGRLQGAGRVATSDRPRADCLFAVEGISEGINLCVGGPSTPSSGVDPGQYCGGTGAAASERVLAASLDRQGQPGRVAHVAHCGTAAGVPEWRPTASARNGVATGGAPVGWADEQSPSVTEGSGYQQPTTGNRTHDLSHPFGFGMGTDTTGW